MYHLSSASLSLHEEQGLKQWWKECGGKKKSYMFCFPMDHYLAKSIPIILLVTDECGLVCACTMPQACHKHSEPNWAHSSNAETPLQEEITEGPMECQKHPSYWMYKNGAAWRSTSAPYTLRNVRLNSNATQFCNKYKAMAYRPVWTLWTVQRLYFCYNLFSPLRLIYWCKIFQFISFMIKSNFNTDFM